MKTDARQWASWYSNLMELVVEQCSKNLEQLNNFCIYFMSFLGYLLVVLHIKIPMMESIS